MRVQARFARPTTSRMNAVCAWSLGLCLLAISQVAPAGKPIPPPLTLAEKVQRSDLIVIARLLGVVCIVPLEEGLRESAACNIYSSEQRHARLLVESTICSRDDLPVAEVVYVPVWFNIVDPAQPKIPYGARYVAYLKRSHLAGPFVADRFHRPDRATPEDTSVADRITTPMLTGCTN